MPTLIKPKPVRWILRGCKHCGGDLLLDEYRTRDGVLIDKEIQYICFLCGRGYEITGMEE